MQPSPSAGTPSSASNGSSRSAGPVRRVLVADDDLAILQVCSRLLARSGFSVDTAEDGSAAWQALMVNDYDLLVTDHNMPKLTGFELVGMIRAAEMTLPVIMATGAFPAQDMSAFPWLQPAVTLLKPYTHDEMIAAINELMRRPQSTPQPRASLDVRNWQSQQSGDLSKPW